MSTQNPYQAVVVDLPKVRTWAFPFAISATISFLITIAAVTGHRLSLYVGTPTAVIQNVVPVFVFAFLVGRFNVISNDTDNRRIAFSGRLFGGCILGAIALPVNMMLSDYLYLIPLPRKIAEVSTVLLVSIVICTASEQMLLRVFAPRRILPQHAGG